MYVPSLGEAGLTPLAAGLPLQAQIRSSGNREGLFFRWN